MSGNDYTITDGGAELLRGVVGKTVSGLEAVIVARDDVAWGAVRMHVGDTPIDVTVTLEDLPINDEGETEGFGTLAVSKATPGKLRVDGVDREPSRCDIGATITGVTLVNGRVMVTERDTVIMERTYTQAVVLTLDKGDCLVLDKGAWFSEMIAVGVASSWEDLVYDDSRDWEDDPEEPGVHYCWQRSTERL